MTRDRLDLLFHHCADLGLDVEWAPLDDKTRGQYRTGNRIVLNHQLTARQVTATLAHEIAHAVLGDVCSTPAIERRAWEYAAAFLITPGEYRRAEEAVGHHPAALAAELEVTPRVIEAWRRWWERRGSATPKAVKGPDSRSDARD